MPLTPYAPVERALPTAAAARGDDLVVSAYEQFHSELYSFLIRATRDASEAEDLLQEAFLRLTREVRAGRVPEFVRAWLYRVGTNLVVSRSRRSATAFRWLSRYGPTDHAATMESPESGAMRREQNAQIEAALADLPSDARVCLLLAGQGFSGREIAAAIGRTEAATRTLLCRSRLRVREQLEVGVEP